MQTKVTINAEDFTAHHDLCLESADALFKLVEELAPISLPFSTKLAEIANNLDRSISKLPVQFKA